MRIFRRSRLDGWVLSGLLVVFVASTYLTVLPQTVYAQEERKPDADDSARKEPPNLFVHLLESVGWFFGPMLFIVSITLVTFIVLLAMDLRMGAAIPPLFVDDFTDLVNKRQFKQAFELCRNDNSYLARVLTAGMGRLQYGIEDARECAMHQVESVKASKEQLNNFVATIGTLGPLVGLVGTVFGMIESFRELSAGGQPRPEKLAAGISHALVVTLFGIALSVPAIFCHTLFKNRLTRIQMDVANLADDLLTQMYHNSRRAASGTTPNPDARTSSTATQAADPRAG
jgi:biopolymer transport protein ExbB